ncbi:MAG: CBS domain-containing protein [Nitrospirae bacterium]|nr:MAG: CBS domain-containing protein [Nitrospirota bacterium]
MAGQGMMARPLAVMMSRSLRTVSSQASLLEAAQLMRNACVGALLVEEQGTYVGVISETDLVRKAMANGEDPNRQRVCAVMSAPLITIEVDQSPHEASELMALHGVRHLVVTQESDIVGMISVRDLLRYFKNWGVL